ncbi:YodC family protein [Mesorhizobium sp. ORM8.1]
MSNTFKTGDVVKLKSGGPPMTVSDGAASGMYLCHWFNRDGDVWTPQHAGFKPDQLIAIDHSK